MKKENICVDFDLTLINHQYSKSENLWLVYGDEYSYTYNTLLIEKLLEYQKENKSLFIVTFRGPSCFHRASSYSELTVEDHVKELKEIYGLEINKIIYTDGQCKLSFLKQLNASIHFDDDQQVIYKIVTDGGGIKPVFIRHKEVEINVELIPWLEQIEIMEIN